MHRRGELVGGCWTYNDSSSLATHVRNLKSSSQYYQTMLEAMVYGFLILQRDSVGLHCGSNAYLGRRRSFMSSLRGYLHNGNSELCGTMALDSAECIVSYHY